MTADDRPVTPLTTAPAAGARTTRQRVLALLGSQQSRYVVIGGANTVFSYSVYTALLWVLDSAGVRWDYVIATAVSWLVSNVTSFFLQRTFVFRAPGNPWAQFARFTSVTLGSFGANIALGIVAVEVLGLTSRNEKLVSQFVITLVLTIGTYLLHRTFSFRTRPAA